MKKAIAILLSLTMILGLAACGNSASQTEQPSTEDTSVESKADQIPLNPDWKDVAQIVEK